MGDPVSASEYYQLHNSFTKQLLDSKSPLLYISYSMLLSDIPWNISQVTCIYRWQVGYSMAYQDSESIA